MNIINAMFTIWKHKHFCKACKSDASKCSSVVPAVVRWLEYELLTDRLFLAKQEKRIRKAMRWKNFQS